jgi:AGZA family xanthine/uracil permease-like MFS transporter
MSRLNISKGDWDGFFAAFINNIVQLLILTPLCLGVLGFSAELVIGRILPGICLSFLVGNLYYAYLAKKLMRREGRTDVCALPYGVSTPAIFANIFLVMLPAKIMAETQGLADPEGVAWRAGLVACLIGGIIEFLGAFCAGSLRKWIPRVALLSTLAGVGLGFLGLAFLFQIMEAPLAGLPVLFLGLTLLLRPFNLPRWLPATGIILVAGTILGWLTGAAPVSTLGLAPLSQLGLYPPIPSFTDLAAGFGNAELATILSVVLPISLLGVIASLQNIESAAASGDSFPEKPCLIVNGIGTIVAACFGSPFPTSIYIGHPAWKKMGAGYNYSIMNGLGIGLVCITGTLAAIVWLIPVEAGITIIFWIGLIIVGQSFETAPVKHYPAAIVGIMPGLAAWVIVLANSIIGGAAQLSGGSVQLNNGFLEQQAMMGNFLGGGIAVQQGFLIVAMLWSAMTVYIIDREFSKASICALVAAATSASGLIHGFVLQNGAAIIEMPLLDLITGATPKSFIAAPAETAGYLIVAAIFYCVHRLQKGTEPHSPA